MTNHVEIDCTPLEAVAGDAQLEAEVLARQDARSALARTWEASQPPASMGLRPALSDDGAPARLSPRALRGKLELAEGAPVPPELRTPAERLEAKAHALAHPEPASTEETADRRPAPLGGLGLPSTAELVAMGRIPAPPVGPAPQQAMQRVRVVLLDAGRAADLDPFVAAGGVYRLVHALSVPAEVLVDGVPAIRLEPMPAGFDAADLSLDALGAIAEAIGFEDDGSEMKGHGRAGLAAMHGVLAGAQREGISGWRREHLARALMAFSVGRAFGLGPDVCESVLSSAALEVEPPTRLLLRPCSEARRIEQARLDAAELAAAEERTRTQAATDRTRPRTLRELRAIGFGMKSEIADPLFSRFVAEAIVETPAGTRPKGLPTWTTPEGLIVHCFSGWPSLVPVVVPEGCELLDPDFELPPSALLRIHPYGGFEHNWVRQRIDTGPVSAFRGKWGSAHDAIVADVAGALRSPSPYNLWQIDLAVEALCRGLLIRPDLLLAKLEAAVHVRGVRLRTAWYDASAAILKVIAGGIVSPGALLNTELANRTIQ